MKKTIIILSATAMLYSCGGGKKENKTDPVTPAPSMENKTGGEVTPPPATTSSSNVVYMADGVEITNRASVLVTKDKENLQAGAPYMCLLTSNAAANNNEYLNINFVFDTKPGTYPVVGAGFQRGKSPNSEMYGGILGGKPTLTNYKINITECKDMGANDMGGHKWSISGNWEDITIEAPKMMLMDPAKKHPKEVKLGKGTFTNLTFDDNWEELLKKGMEKMKK